jgi:hypothetical protein
VSRPGVVDPDGVFLVVDEIPDPAITGFSAFV